MNHGPWCMPETTAMATISLYYWAGARAAAGVEMDRFDADSVGQALDAARAKRPAERFHLVLSASTVLIDGQAAHPEDLARRVQGAVRVEILPPFAGGSVPEIAE